jgi:hypothetical protein
VALFRALELTNEKRRFVVKAQFPLFFCIGLVGVSVQVPSALSADEATGAQNHKPLMINRLYTGPDGQTHVEEIEAKFAPGGGVEGYKLLANAGASFVAHLQVASPIGTRRPAGNTSSPSAATASWRFRVAKRSWSGQAASNWSRTSPAKATSPGQWATKIA